MTLGISFYDGIKYPRTAFIDRDLDFFGNGVVALTDFPLTFPSTPNMTTNVGQGRAWVDGYRASNDSTPETLTFAAADPTYPRIDIIQIGHDDINSLPSLVVKKGVAQTNPVEPGADPGYVKLWAMNIAAGATSITSANAIDRRALVPLNVSGTQINLSGAAGTGQNNTFAAGYTQTFDGPAVFNNTVTMADGFNSTVAQGATPFTVTSTTKVTNLNVDQVDGYDFNQSLKTADSPTFAAVTAGTFTSTVAQGTSPFAVTSTTKVSNLNTDLIDGYDTATAATPNTVVVRNADGSITTRVNPNILFNPTGALGTAGWTDTGTGTWSNGFGTNGDGSFFWSPNITTAGSWATLNSASIPSVANETYHIHGEISTLNLTAGNAMIYVFAYNSAGTQLQSWNTPYIAANGGAVWSPVDVTITTPANTDHFVVQLATDNLAVGFAAFRKVKVEQGSVASAYTDDNTLNTVRYATNYAGIFSGADTWHQPTLLNAWTNYGGTYAVVAYRKDANGLVHTKGFAHSGTMTSGTGIFNYPAGYRAAETRMFTTSCDTGHATIQLNTTGDLVVNSVPSNGWLSFEIKPFFAEA